MFFINVLQHFSEINDIFANKHSIQPTVTAGSSGLRFNQTETVQKENSSGCCYCGSSS